MKISVLIHGEVEIDLGAPWVLPQDRDRLAETVACELAALVERHAELNPVPHVRAVSGEPIRVSAN